MRMRHRLFLLAFAGASAWGGPQGIQPGTVTIDTQEWRDKPFRHFYIHGTINGDTNFHLFLPPRELWGGRLLQFLQGGLGGSEFDGVKRGHLDYALANGAAYVESNQGHVGQAFFDEDDTPDEVNYQANYSVVQYAKARCVEFYGKEPKYTYIFGGSGGAFRSTSLIERFPKVYDGAVPIVGGGQHKFAIFCLSLSEMYWPLIAPKGKAMDDRMRAGGSGKPEEALDTALEREALRMLLEAGYPRSGLGFVRPRATRFSLIDYLKYKVDPEYFEVFWKVPGYGGADGEFNRELVAGVRGTVRAVDAGKRLLRTDVNRGEEDLGGFTVTLTSGAAAGEWRRVEANTGGDLVIGPRGPGVEKIKPGDTFILDNRDLIAWRAYHRHIVEPDEPAMRNFVEHSRPKYPPRPKEKIAALEEPDRPVGNFAGKMIAVYGAGDQLAWPTVPIRYHRQVREAKGGRIDDHLRLHFIEHGVHTDVANDPAREVPNKGAVCKALDDLMAWVEKGVAPPAGTRYSVSDANELLLEKGAARRLGYQPLVTLKANQRTGRLEAAVGELIVFSVYAEDPDNEVALIEMDFDGNGRFDASKSVHGRSASAEFSHRYNTPGVYFPVTRVTDSTISRGCWDKGIKNIDSVRVVVK